MAAYQKSYKRPEPVELYFDESYVDPSKRKFKASVDDIKIKLNPNFVPGDQTDGIKTPFRIYHEKDGIVGRPLLVIGDRKQGRVSVPLPIKKYNKQSEGYLSVPLNPEVEHPQKVLEFLFLLKQKIHTACKENSELFESDSLTDDQVDQIVQFPTYSIDGGNDNLRVKVRVKSAAGNIQPKVFHKSRKQEQYKDLNMINQVFDPKPEDPTKRFNNEMTLYVELENCYFNFKRNMETKEFDRDDDGKLIPKLYPVFSLYQAVVGTEKEKESTGIQTKIFEIQDFPAECMSYEGPPFVDDNEIPRVYNNLKIDDTIYNWRCWIRNVSNPYGISVDPKTGEPTHLSVLLEGKTGDHIKNLMDVQKQKAIDCGLKYPVEFFNRKKMTKERVLQEMEDKRGQVNVFYQRKRDEDGDLTDEVDQDKPPQIRIKTATNKETGEYRFPVCFQSDDPENPSPPLPHDQADNFLKTRGTTYDILFGPKTLSQTSKFTQPLCVHKIIAYQSVEKACGIMDDDSDDE